MFGNFVLADEINRAPAKVQSALLEVMQEQQVTIGGKTFEVPRPFLVMATQNPIESEGTYPLPEAQVDRFLMKVIVDYPTYGEEAAVVGRSLGPEADVRERLSLEDLAEYTTAAGAGARRPRRDRLRRRAGRRHAAPDRVRPRRHRPVSSSSAPARAGRSASCRRRARSRCCAAAATSIADDIHDLAADVLRHRIVLSYDALSEGDHRRRSCSTAC